MALRTVRSRRPGGIAHLNRSVRQAPKLSRANQQNRKDGNQQGQFK
jgi:hypothetical protein